MPNEKYILKVTVVGFALACLALAAVLPWVVHSGQGSIVTYDPALPPGVLAVIALVILGAAFLPSLKRYRTAVLVGLGAVVAVVTGLFVYFEARSGPWSPHYGAYAFLASGVFTALAGVVSRVSEQSGGR